MTIQEMKVSLTSNKGTLTRLTGAVKVRAETFVAIKSPDSATALNEGYNKYVWFRSPLQWCPWNGQPTGPRGEVPEDPFPKVAVCVPYSALFLDQTFMFLGAKWAHWMRYLSKKNCDTVVLESICYRTRADRLINESNTTEWLIFFDWSHLSSLSAVEYLSSSTIDWLTDWLGNEFA